MSMVKSAKYRHLGGNVAGGDPDGFEYDVAEWLTYKFPVKTVLDVGCGEGQMVRVFQTFGCQAIGLDGLPRNAEVSGPATIVWDLTKGPLRIDKIDLVWAVEVAEHVGEEFVDNFIQTITNGEIVVMTYAAPGQGGYHHVNEQPEEYWVAKMKEAGYGYLENETLKMREVAQGFVARTGLMFGRTHCSQ